MTNVLALNRVLPAISIATDRRAQINGSHADIKLNLLVPPAGWIEPAVSVTDLLAFALSEAGRSHLEATSMAAEMASVLLTGLLLERRPVMLDCWRDMPVCCSVSDGVRALCSLGRQEAQVAETLNRFADEAACARVFEYGEFGQNAVGLRELGPGPLQSGLTEFWPSVELCLTSGDDDTPPEVRDWLEGIRPEIEALEAAVGTQLFHFGKPGYPPDDDEGHRFLALDCVCFVMPNSRFVEYLVDVAEAPSVEALRAALRAPAAYSSDFRLFDSFLGPQVSGTQQFQIPVGNLRSD